MNEPIDFSGLEALVARGKNLPKASDVSVPRLDREAARREQTREMYAAYQKNLQNAGILRSKILKGIQAGEPLGAVLLQALECISSMTGDTQLYEQGKNELIAVYGHGFGEQSLIDLELSEVQGRLERLEAAEAAESEPSVKRRIGSAIVSHRQAVEQLTKIKNCDSK